MLNPLVIPSACSPSKTLDKEIQEKLERLKDEKGRLGISAKLGVWRPERHGSFGKFRVTEWQRLE